MKKPTELNEMSFDELKALRDLCDEYAEYYKSLLGLAYLDNKDKIIKEKAKWEYRKSLVDDKIGHKLRVYFNEKSE